MNISVLQASSLCLKTGVRKSLVQKIDDSRTHRSAVGSIAVHMQMQCRYSRETGQITKSAQNTIGTNTPALQLHPQEDQLKNYNVELLHKMLFQNISPAAFSPRCLPPHLPHLFDTYLASFS